eukprot:357218-Chlamydomonas_euryale.AAC.24
MSYYYDSLDRFAAGGGGGPQYGAAAPPPRVALPDGYGAHPCECWRSDDRVPLWQVFFPCDEGVLAPSRAAVSLLRGLGGERAGGERSEEASRRTWLELRSSMLRSARGWGAGLRGRGRCMAACWLRGNARGAMAAHARPQPQRLRRRHRRFGSRGARRRLHHAPPPMHLRRIPTRTRRASSRADRCGTCTAWQLAACLLRTACACRDPGTHSPPRTPLSQLSLKLPNNNAARARAQRRRRHVHVTKAARSHDAAATDGAGQRTPASRSDATHQAGAVACWTVSAFPFVKRRRRC